jgi:DNA-binding NarL/FixJ family response regulator
MSNSPPRVLLIEDAAMLREIFKHTFTHIGCEIVAEGTTEKAAVELYEKHQPDIVFLDIRLAIGDGIDALAEIMSRDPQAYVVMLTVYDDQKTREKCLDMGAKHYLIKGRPADALIRDVKALLQEFLEPDE